jgi:hypothetical protein
MVMTLQDQDALSSHQISDKTFSSIKQCLQERGAFAFTALELERQWTVWKHDAEYRILYDTAEHLGAMHRGPQVQNMLPI